MTLTQFFSAIRKRWVYVLVPLLLSCLAVGTWSLLSTPIYTAKASAYFSLSYGETPGDLYQGSNYTQQQIASYAQLATTPVVLQPVIDELQLDTTVPELAQTVAAKATVDSVIVDITAESPSPTQAAQIANAVVEQLGEVVSGLSPKVNGHPSVEATTVARAVPPQFQTSPNTKLNVLVAGVAGLMVGVLLALAREHFDTRLRSREDLPDASSVLASVGQDKEVRRQPVRVLAGGIGRHQRAVHEAFRTLRTNLGFLDVDSQVRMLVVTSSIPGEGKTTISLNLAAVLAEDGSQVIVIDADLRRPKVGAYLGIEGSLGLADVVAGHASLPDVVQPWGGKHLYALPAGTTPPNPVGLLGSHAMGELLDQLRTEYDYVIIDAPPLVPVTDAAVIAKRVDGAIMVVRSGRTTRRQFTTAMDSIEAAQARMLGVVLNRMPAPRPWEKASVYEYYSTKSATTVGSAT